MLIVDASILFEIVADAPGAERLRERLLLDPDLAAPHLVDAEVLGVIQRERRVGRLDRTAASQAVDDLRAWPGERWGHQPLLWRAWELRANVRSNDALYVALAEGLGATLLTLDERLARAPGLRCSVEIPEP
jgi:predicted nucleic acid-binding protein